MKITKLIEESEKGDFIIYSLAEISTTRTPRSQIYIIIPGEDCVISLLNSHLVLNFEVIKKADNSRYANGNDIRLANLRPIVLISSFKLTTFSGKHPEDLIHAHIVSSMYELKTSAKDGDDLSLGFNRESGRRQDQLIKIKK